MGLGIGIGISPTLMTGVGGDPILAAFADGTDGFYFDFSKTDRLFQDTTGVTAADDPNESIGLALEGSKWGGLTLAQKLAAQPELLVGSPLNGTTYPFTVLSVSGPDITLAQKGAGIGGATWDLGSTFPIGAVVYVSLPVTVNSGAPGRAVVVTDRSGSGFFSSAAVTLAAGANVMRLRLNVAARYLEVGNAASATDIAILGPSAKLIPGNHGSQATAAARPKWQTGGFARLDGVDDNLLVTNYLPATGVKSLMAKVAIKANGANAVLMGSRAGGSNNNWFIQLDVAGNLVVGIGSASSVVTSGVDYRNRTGVIALVSDGVTASLYWNAVLVGSMAVTGGFAAPNAVAIGGLNTAGTVGFFAAADHFYDLAISKSLAASEIAAITNNWGTS